MTRGGNKGSGGKWNAVAVVQARMSSTRLPGKTLREMGGVPMLQRLLERVGSSESGAYLVVATSDEASDDPVADLCTTEGIPCVRGPLEDVLGRFVRVLNRFKPRLLVRLTGDNPLVDARAVRAGIEAFREHAEAWQPVGVSNHLEDRTDPYGYCVEVVRSGPLRELDRLDPTQEEREHVTLGFRRRCDFGLGSYSILPGDQRGLRWTVDSDADFRYIERLFEALGPNCTAEMAVRWSRSNTHPLESDRATVDDG